MDWYGLAFDDRQFRDLAAHLVAFVGRSYSDFEGRPATLDLEDPVEAAVARVTGHRAYRFRAPGDDASRAELRDQLVLMRDVWAQTPERAFHPVRPIGRILQDLDMALAARDGTASAVLLGELKEHGHVSAHNLLFLRLRRLASLGQWAAMLRLEEVTTVLAAPRPRLVTQDLIRAVYNVHLSGFEQAGDARAALTQFAETVFPSYPALFKSWGGLTAPEALKSFVLAAAAPGRVDIGLREAILASPAVRDEDRPWLAKLADLSAPAAPPEVGGLVGARQAVHDERYDDALRLLESSPAGRERSELLIETALYVESLAAAAMTIDVVDGLPAETRERLLDSPVYGLLYSHVVERLQNATAHVPSGWLQWLEQFEALADAALPLAREATPEWSLEAELSDPQEVRRFVDLVMATRDDAAAATLRDAIPLMLESLAPAPRVEFRAAYEALAETLMTSPGIGGPHLAVIDELLRRRLVLGTTDAEYQQIVRDYVDLWQSWGNAYHLDWLLEAIDGLLEHAASGRRGADNLLTLASTWTSQHAARVESYQWGRLGVLAEDAGLQELASTFSAKHATRVETQAEQFSAARTDLAGKVVAIYTLTERAGRQAKTQIKRDFPGAAIELRSDRVSSQPLTQLAKSADIFIFAWQSAAHAATDTIQATRPRHLPLLPAAGKGATSLVRALHAHLGLST